MLPDASVTHRISTRQRIRIPAKRGDVGYFALLQERLSQQQGVERVEVNPVTGSVLLVTPMETGALAEYASANNLFRLRGPAEERPSPVFERITGRFRNLDAHARRFTAGELDIASVVFLLLLGAGVYQISRGNFGVPAWYTAFWYAFGVMSGSGHIDGGDE